MNLRDRVALAVPVGQDAAGTEGIIVGKAHDRPFRFDLLTTNPDPSRRLILNVPENHLILMERAHAA